MTGTENHRVTEKRREKRETDKDRRRNVRRRTAETGSERQTGTTTEGRTRESESRNRKIVKLGQGRAGTVTSANNSVFA